MYWSTTLQSPRKVFHGFCYIVSRKRMRDVSKHQKEQIQLKSTAARKMSILPSNCCFFAVKETTSFTAFFLKQKNTKMRDQLFCVQLVLLVLISKNKTEIFNYQLFRTHLCPYCWNYAMSHLLENKKKLSKKSKPIQDPNTLWFKGDFKAKSCTCFEMNRKTGINDWIELVEGLCHGATHHWILSQHTYHASLIFKYPTK